MRKVVSLIATVALFALPPSLASATGKPTRAPVPDSMFIFSVPAGVFCPFPLSGVPAVNNSFVTTFPAESNGDVVQRFTGRVVARFTNDATGKSIEANVSGPFTQVIHPDGSITQTFEGPTALGSIIPPFPSGLIVDGRTVVDISPSGQSTLVSFTGTVKLDVCAALS